MSFCPEKIGNSSSSPWKDLGFSPRSTQSCFPLLQGPSCRKSPSALLRSDWVKYDYNRRSDRKKRFFRSNRGLQPSWIGKVQTVISFNWAPREAGNSSGYRPWRKLRLILKRGRPISNIFGAKAHANVLKDTFSTDCKSNCIRIGLSLFFFCFFVSHLLSSPTNLSSSLPFVTTINHWVT